MAPDTISSVARPKSLNHTSRATSRTPVYRILIITPVFPPHVTVGGGVAVTCGALTDKLIERGCVVNVLSPRLGNVDFGTSLLYPAFPVQFPTLYNLKLFWRCIKDADIVCCPDNTVMPFLLTFCHILGTPLWFNLHTNVKHLLEMTGPFGKYVSAPICDAFIRTCSNLSAATYTTSPSYRDVLLERGYRVDGIFSPKIKLSVFEADDHETEILEARRWLVKEKALDKTLLLYAGRFSHEKRINLLVSTLPENCALAIVGDGPGYAGDRISNLHDPSRNIFVHRGMVNQARLRLLYKASDFLVSASAFETLGMTVAEANACGTPVIVQRATGFSTQVVQGENGFLINFEDPAEARPAIQYAIKHRPSPKQIKSVINSDTFWFSGLPNLEDEVLKMAEIGNNRKKWGSGEIRTWLMVPMLIVFYFAFWIFGFPFNKVTDYADRKNQGPRTFTSSKLSSKGAR